MKQKTTDGEGLLPRGKKRPGVFTVRNRDVESMEDGALIVPSLNMETDCLLVTISDVGDAAFWGDVADGRKIGRALGVFIFSPTEFCG
jgi:hypothetical protein